MTVRKSFLMRFAEMVEEYRAERRAALAAEATPQPKRPSRMRRFLRWLMPNGGTLLLAALLILTQNVWARRTTAPTTATSAVATTINYQGHLADANGNPLNGTVSLTFAIYDAETGGNVIWGPETHAAVNVQDGLFSVGLGTIQPLSAEVWTGGDRYLEITVNGQTLSPREPIRAVPFAQMAWTVPDGSITTDKIAEGTITRDDRAPWYQVTAAGDASATATCPAGTRILVGWKLHMTTDGQMDKNSWGACTPGETECSIQVSDTPGDDEVRIWMICE